MANRNKELDAEDKELLSSLPSIDVYRPLLKLLNLLVEDQSKELISADLSKTTDRDLTIIKARSEGAAKLVRDLDTLLTRFSKTVKNVVAV